MHRPTVVRRLLGLALVGGALLVFVLPAAAAETEITSAGPLTRIIVSDDLSCQVAHRDDDEFEFFPPGSSLGSCGTFLALGGTVYGPLGGSPTLVVWTPVSQSLVSGRGTSGDPFRIVTVVDLPEAGLRITQTDSYVVGSQSYRTDIQIQNVGNAIQTGVVYRAGDCYLQGDDAGLVRVDGGAPACIVDPAEGRRIEQWLPITPGSHYFAGGFGEVWSLVSGQENFPDRCACDATTIFDNGAGLSWSLNLAPGLTATYSHETFFSPFGRGAVQESLRDSVPTAITLDPIVVAQSVAITAGVILLVPFPSALFNSTLEENYDEVMAGVARIRAGLAALGRSLLAGIRQFIDARRAPTGGPAPPLPAEQQPLVAPVDHLPVPPTPTAGPRPAGDLWATPLGIFGFVLLTALLYAFLDPTFGLSVESLATLAGLAVGLFAVLGAYGIPLVVLARSSRIALTVRALPATLAIGLLCVLVSRFTDFQPGYLYGLIIGFIFARGTEARQEGRAEAIAAMGSLAVALVAWLALVVLRASAGAGNDLSTIFIETAAVTTVVAGLENAVFAMLPLRFLPGAAVLAWNRRVWVLLMGLGVLGFVHVLLNPAEGTGYLADTTRTSFFTLIALLVAFGLASVLFWAWFRFRPARAPA
jgi:hypothetical protein